MVECGSKDDIDFLLNQASRVSATRSGTSSVAPFGAHNDADLFASSTLENRYSLDDFASDSQATFSEINQHNLAVFETRVAKSFLNECLARALYRQRLLQHTHALRERHREVAAMHRRIEASIPTPRAMRLAAEARVHANLTGASPLRVHSRRPMQRHELPRLTCRDMLSLSVSCSLSSVLMLLCGRSHEGEIYPAIS